MELLLELLEIAHRLLEAVVVEQDRSVLRVHVEQTQALASESLRVGVPVPDDEHTENARLAAERSRDRLVEVKLDEQASELMIRVRHG